MLRSVLVLAGCLAFVVAAGCGPGGNNQNSKDTGPAPKVNPKGPPPMKGPGDGLPPKQK